MEGIKNITVSAKELADLFGYDEKYISELVHTQGMPKEDYGKFNLFDCVKWHTDYKARSFQKAIEKLKNEDEKKRLTRANADLKELIVEDRRKNLVPFEEVKRAWIEEMKILAVNLDGIPLKAALEIEGVTDRKEIENIIRKHLNEAREKIGNLSVRSADELLS